MFSGLQEPWKVEESVEKKTKLYKFLYKTKRQKTGPVGGGVEEKERELAYSS